MKISYFNNQIISKVRFTSTVLVLIVLRLLTIKPPYFVRARYAYASLIVQSNMSVEACKT